MQCGLKHCDTVLIRDAPGIPINFVENYHLCTTELLDHLISHNGYLYHFRTFTESYSRLCAIGETIQIPSSAPGIVRHGKETSATIVEQLKSIDSTLDVNKDIGGCGVAAVLRNGSGPVVMLRANFDALPIEEQTGLQYASKKLMKDAEGKEKPVAHACGHGMHATCLIGAGKLLASIKESWSGTLILVLRPAEARGTGAQAMVDDRLYEKHNVPVPDIVLAGYVMPNRPGLPGTRQGLMANSADTLHVTLHGRGAHSSMPDRSVDPVVMAASTVMKLQTVVSRETQPNDSNVLTVASLHAGHSDNVIADDAKMAIDIRTST